LKKILFVKGFSESIQSANTLCMEALAKAFNGMNDIQVEFVWDGISVDQMNPLDRHNIGQFLTKVWYWPSYDRMNIISCYKSIKNKLEKEKYDAVLVGHMPYDVVEATMRIKKEFPDIKIVLYEMDPINYEIERRFSGLRRFVSFKRLPAEIKAYRNFDFLVKMIANKSQYSKRIYREFDKKTLYLDFPLIEKNANLQERKTLNSRIKMVYAGRVNLDYRSPSYLLKLLVSLSKELEYDAIFYSRGNAIGEIISTSKDCKNIQLHDYVPTEKLNEIMNNADCLLSVGNKYSNMLPSKILSYISMGKPIIHIKTQDNDICESYLDKYPLALIISEKDDIKKATKKMHAFIFSSRSVQLASKDIERLYPMNIPEYSAGRIRQTLNI